MKIRTVQSAVVSPYKVGEKSDKEGFSQNQRDAQDRQTSEEPEVEVTDEKVSQAIDAFGAELKEREGGLHAEQVGSGPGLRVVLKDGSGRVIRQLSGQDFLKMRQAVSLRILDQKF